MALYRAANLAEGIIVPEFYASEVGLIEMLVPCVRLTACSFGEIGGRGLLVPQFAAVWPLHTVAATLLLIHQHVIMPPPLSDLSLPRHH